MAKNENLPTNAQVELFKMLDVLLNSIYFEMKEFSKKKPDEPLNKFKVKNVNRVLEQIKDILKAEPTSPFLDILNEDTLPTNSDAILVIGQFRASMARFQKKYAAKYGKWKTKENPTGI
ncbi:hypothetical protein [Aureispira anguillae]|uniref:Uncharacterized protein n=1 Tax=Aureispira anguillae TaxID=2864201 RepID=A0A915YE69_9BACT|nr:hypothetical protein [Aureispira anguillae]BDS11480.1 hypothetical protein AsAng_0021940 [Aureispira anguillae]